MRSFRKVGAIKNLEVASVCNLACPYCPARLQGEHRETGLMREEVFDRALFWLRRFVAAGTQRELNLFGVGEPLLHPSIVDYARRVREVLPRYLCGGRPTLLFNTNGLLFTEEACRALYDAGVDKIDLTDHEAAPSAKAIAILRKVTGHYYPVQQDPTSTWGYSRDGVINPNNWGGLIDWVPEVEHPRYPCPWLVNGQVMVMSDGAVTRCCQDAFARGVLCTVFDDVERFDHDPFVQCATCHEEVPAGMPKPTFKTEKEKIA